MATIKSYTDIEQSRKLAEILPLESADMVYFGIHQGMDGKYYLSGTNTEDDVVPIYKNLCTKVFVKATESDITCQLPCWSLASLLELLPKRIEIVDNVYELSVYLYGIYYWNVNNGNLCFESKDKDNLVDACYEAIVFLHELKML